VVTFRIYVRKFLCLMHLTFEMKVCFRRNWLEPNFNIKEYQTRPTFCGTETEEPKRYSIEEQKTAFLCLEQDTVYSVSS
jgi:hypothetical protein